MHYHCARDLLACLARLQEDEPALQLVVVENDPEHASARELRDKLPDSVTRLEAQRNRGFGAGCNLGIEYALARWPGLEHLLLLNPDTLPEPGFLAELLSTRRRHPDAGVVGARILDLAGAQTLFANGRIRYLSLHGSHVPAPPGPKEFRTSFVTGACMLLDAGLLRQGLRFDERYFLYAEDLDLCQAVLERGRSIWINSRARVRHREGGAQQEEAAVLGGLRRRQLREMTRGKVIFARKWLRPWQRLLFYAIAGLLKPLVALGTGRLRALPPYLSGFAQGLRLPLNIPEEGPVRRDTPAAEPELGVVVLNWNGRADTLACLRALRPQLGPGDQVFVVDNASDDDSVAAIQAAFPEQQLLCAPRNLGFAGGNNLGLRAALQAGLPWMLLLNNDTLPPPGFLAGLRRAAAKAHGTGALQALLVAAEDPARIDSAGHRLHADPGVRDARAGQDIETVGAGAQPIFGACAAAALLRREALEECGLLDEDLFVLFEDVDLMFRMRSQGWRVRLLPELQLPHRRGVSGRGDRRARRRRAFWVHRNLLALALRWWPGWRLLSNSPVLILRAGLALLAAGRNGEGRRPWPARRHCLQLWWRSLRQRRRSRRGMRIHGVDGFFGQR